MRLLTWNIARGSAAEKLALITPLAADIVVLQECARPDDNGDQQLWYGTNVRKGVSVHAFGEFHLKSCPIRSDAPAYFVPVEIVGPESFMVFAVWAQKEPFPYVEGVSRAIESYADIIAGRPTVLLGDFNSNAIWDHAHPVEHNHSAIVAELDRLGAVSAYHSFFDEAHGREEQFTYFHWWKEAHPFHLDYVFIPKPWLPRLEQVEVGSFAAYDRASDHRPVLVRIRD